MPYPCHIPAVANRLVLQSCDLPKWVAYGKKSDKKAGNSIEVLKEAMLQGPVEIKVRFGMNAMKVTMLIIVIIGVAGAVFLANWHIPAPTKIIDKVVSNETFVQ